MKITNHFVFKQDILNQLPTCIAWKDDKSIFMGGNELAAKYCGLKSPLELEGLTDYEVKAPFAQHAEEYKRQDQIVLKEKTTLDIFGVYLCNHGIYETVMTRKVPLRKDNIVIGTLYQATVLSKKFITSFVNALLKIDNKYDDFNKNKQRSYLCNRKYIDDEINLTQRESECLFFILRGSPLPKIANILNISARTVEKHIENIKAKMGVHFKSQLIERAIAKGYLYTIPWFLNEQNFNVLVAIQGAE